MATSDRCDSCGYLPPSPMTGAVNVFNMALPAGHWRLPCGGTYIAAPRKPNWFRRQTNRIMLGWTWEDRK